MSSDIVSSRERPWGSKTLGPLRLKPSLGPRKRKSVNVEERSSPPSVSWILKPSAIGSALTLTPREELTQEIRWA